MNRISIALILMLSLFILPLLSQDGNDEYVEETIVLEPENHYSIEKIIYDLDGWHDDLYSNSTINGVVGDYTNYLTNEQSSFRHYFQFPFQDLLRAREIVSITLNAYQQSCTGNMIDGQFPVFYNNSYNPLKVALFDFDMNDIDYSFNATSSTEIGIISDNSTVEWKQLDVTQAYLDAQNTLGYPNFSLMFYFDVISDNDMMSDFVGINFSDPSLYPSLTFVYRDFTPNQEGESEPVQANIQCYPNPASDKLTLKSDGASRITQLSIYNIKGQKVFTKQNVNSQNDELNLNLPHNLATGIYFVKCKIEGEQQAITKKVFIKKEF